jgi:hypothetical protein
MKRCTLMPSLGTPGLRSGNNASMSGRSTWSSASLRLVTGELAGPHLDLSPLPVEPAITSSLRTRLWRGPPRPLFPPVGGLGLSLRILDQESPGSTHSNTSTMLRVTWFGAAVLFLPLLLPH